MLLTGQLVFGASERIVTSNALRGHQPSGAAFQDREDDLGPVRRLVWARLFGQCVGKTREAAGRSVEEAARLAGMETSQWAAIEAGYELLSSTNIPSEQEISFMRETIHRQSQEI